MAAVPVLCASVDPAVELGPLLDSPFVSSSMSDSGAILDYSWLPLSSSSSSSIISLLLLFFLETDDYSSEEPSRLLA